MPKISVVLPTYNGECYLDEAIRGVVAQTLKDWELIIIDDCSSDDTSRIAEGWANADSRIRYFRNKENMKLPRSLNEGFSHASGEYYTWTSDDNIFLDDAFELMASQLDSNRSIDLVYCDISRIDENGSVSPYKGFAGSPSLIYFFNVVQACFLYRSHVHDKLNGYDPDLYLVEDYDFWIRAYRSFRFFHIENEHPYLYRMHSGSLTSTRTRDIRKRACGLLKREAACSDLSLLRRACAMVGLLYNYMQYCRAK